MSDNPRENPAVGIDLGTTNTVIAVMCGEGEGPVVVPVPQPTHEDRTELVPLNQIKSAVWFHSPGRALVGAAAADRPDAFRSAKSKMGTRWRATHRHFPDATLTAPYVSAHVLRLAFETLTAAYPGWDRTAVITVPASFNTTQRADTLRAAKLAGFPDAGVTLLDEPTAAFCYHVYNNEFDEDFRRERMALVFDFGGGTLDVSVIHIAPRGDDGLLIDPVGRSRYNNLGGDDIDRDLAAYLLARWEAGQDRQLRDLPGETRAELYRRFVGVAEKFKENTEEAARIGGRPEYLVAIDDRIEAGQDALAVHLDCRLAPEDYDEFTGRYLRDAAELNVFQPIEEALQLTRQIRGEFDESQIDLLLHTGGSSRLGAVARALDGYARRRLFGADRFWPIDEDHPWDTVALGAAFYRYQQRYGQGRIEITHRILESILTRDDAGLEFVELVPVHCVPGADFQDSKCLFRTEQPVIRVKRPLFRGTGPNDHQLVAITELATGIFEDIVPAGTSYRIAYRMSPSKVIELRVALELAGGPPPEVVTIDPFAATAEPVHLPDLCRVNAT